ncbi:MAG: SBBP repeat-containing protein [Bacteroidota bacterium]
MKQNLLLCAFTLLSMMLGAQSEPKAFLDWSTTAGSQNFFYKNITKTDSYGNVYVAGATLDSLGATDLLLAKYNSGGVQLWIRQYGTPGLHDFAGGLFVTDTHAYLTGAVTTNTTVGTTDMLTIKYDAAGTSQWVATYDGGNDLPETGKDIRVDASGNVYATGGGYNGSFNTDFLTIKYNSSGTQQWVNAYDYSSNLDDAAYKVALSGSNVLISGAVTHAANSYKYNTITLTQSTGSLTATNTSTATTTNSVDVVSDLVIDASGNAYLAGATMVGGQGYNYYILKMATSNLTTQWQTTWNGTDNLDDVAKGIQVDASGNVYVTGYSTTLAQGRDMVTKKYNSSGTLQWTETYNSAVNGNDEGADIAIDASGNIYVTGSTASEINQSDYYTIKYNSSGTKLWDVQNDATHTNDMSTNITLDSLNNVIISGSTETAPGTYKYYTAQLVQKDVITPTDYNLEIPDPSFMYYQNKGQIADPSGALVPDVKFYTHHTYPAFCFKKNSMSMIFSMSNDISDVDTLHRIDMTFDNVKSSSKTYPMEEQKKGYLNYYLGHTGADGVTGVFGNKYLFTPEIYTNIDVIYSSNENGIKYYFIVKPGGNPADIAMTFTGATSYSLDGTTNALSINSSIGSLTYDRPTVYQLTTGNSTVAVSSWTPAWQTNGGSNKYTFNSGSYTSSLTLIIEVDQGNSIVSFGSGATLCWSTYFGGSTLDESQAITKDDVGNQFIAGHTMSPSPVFPTTTTAFQGAIIGELSGFYSKFNTSNALIYSTYYGGGGGGYYTSFFDIKCKNSNEILVAGYTTCNNAGTMIKSLSGAYNNASYPGGSSAGFITRFDASGNRVWASYLGGASSRIKAIDFDSNGNLYAGGYTSSTNFPLTTTPNYNQSFGGVDDSYLLKLNSSYAMSWSTYIGGNSYDRLTTIKVDNSNRVLVFGSTESSNFPTFSTGSAFIDNSLGGTVDNFVGAFSSTAQRLWLTYLGGSGYEAGMEEGLNNIATNNSSIFVVGSTQSSNFPFLNPGGAAFYDNSISTNTFPGYAVGDGYITEFDMTTFQQKWGTVVSGDGVSVFKAAVIDGSGNLFITGSTGDHTIPLISATAAYNQSTYPGGAIAPTPSYQEDGILLNFKTATRDLVWSTLIGGYNDHPYGEDLYDMMIMGSDIYITGHTSSRNNPSYGLFPLWNPGSGAYFDGSFNGNAFDSQDAFVAKFCYNNITGINEIQDKTHHSLLAYPNPATNKLTINLDNQNFMSNLIVTIYSSNGQLVYDADYNLNTGTIEINTANMAEGMYLIKVSDKINNYTAKFIKQ